MNFIKKYKAVILIVLFAFIIRLINLDKTGGLWYDEINIYYSLTEFSCGYAES